MSSYTKKEDQFSTDGIFENFTHDLVDLIDAEDGPTLNIINFIEREVDLGIELTREQNLILKCIYNLELDDVDKRILRDWGTNDRTNWEEGNHYQTLVWESGRRSGKCISLSNSYIFSDKGILLMDTLKGDTKEGESREINLNISSGTNEIKEATHFYNNGYKKVKELKTDLGYTLAGVPEHRVKIINEEGNLEWKYFQDIKEKDYVSLSKGPDIWSKEYISFHENIEGKGHNQINSNPLTIPKVLDENYSYLLGLMVGDGTWNGSNICISGLREDLESYVSILTPSFEGATIKIRDSGKTLCIGNSLLMKAFKSLGYVTKNRSSKRIPWSILQSPKSVVASFLRGLFDTDGYISKDAKQISLSTACEDLARDVKLLLLNFGIVTSTRIKLIKGKNYYEVTIIGLENRRIFARDIGFGLSRKAERLRSISSSQREGGSYLKIPNQKKWLQKLRSSIPKGIGEYLGTPGGRGFLGTKKSNKDYRSQLRAIVGNCIKEGCKEKLSYTKLVKLNRWLEDKGLCELYEECYEHFREIEEANYFYDSIYSLQEYWDETGDLCVPENKTYVANGIVSHNTSIVSVLATYEFYRLCKLDSPQRYYKLATSTPISILVIATTKEQTVQVTFSNIVGTIQNCKYFKRLEEKGELKIGVESIKYPRKNLALNSGNSKSSSQVGGTVKALILDEVARFADANGKSNAEEIWTNVGAALTTFREHALRVAISSAWCEGDAIQKLYNDAQKTSTTIAFRLRSKDVNPIHGGDDNPFVRDMLESNPEQAYLEFYGIRPSAVDAYLTEKSIDKAFKGKNQILFSPYQKKIAQDEYLSCLNIENINSLGNISGNIVHLDPALKGDFYGGALGHAEFDEDENLIVVIDSVFCWEGSRKANVSITDVYKVLSEINRILPIEKVSADQWNSAETLQKFRADGISTESLSFSGRQQLSIYGALKLLLEEERIILPKTGRWQPLLERELKQVQLLNGKKIDHPANGGSKDLADCIASIAFQLSERTNRDLANHSSNAFASNTIKSVNFGAKYDKRKSIMRNISNRKAFFRQHDR